MLYSKNPPSRTRADNGSYFRVAIISGWLVLKLVLKADALYLCDFLKEQKGHTYKKKAKNEKLREEIKQNAYTHLLIPVFRIDQSDLSYL